MIIINKYDEVIFLYSVERARKAQEREGEKEEDSAQAKKLISPVVCIRFMPVTYSTKTDIKTSVKSRSIFPKTKICQPSDL